ncbi:MAG: ATP-binding cassette domain-containing protein [Spirochaetota bacterium]|nr:ATP-binding cassette domain-containing protein [Spirochaetota bacterium]
MEEVDILKIEGVSYESDRRGSLYDISFSIKRGEFVVIFGPEDSGIELICPLIAGIVEKFEGDIYYEDKSIKTFDYIEKHIYKKKLGYLQRGYGLINNMSMEANISLPLKYHSQLSNLEINDIVEKYIKEMNLDHCRGLRPIDLSNSEALKIAYARSIALDPDLLLIEHPFEGQCLINSQTFINSLKRYSTCLKKSVIFITYEPQYFIDLSHTFIMFYDGRIVFAGSKNEFRIAENRYLSQYLQASCEGPMNIL